MLALLRCVAAYWHNKCPGNSGGGIPPDTIELLQSFAEGKNLGIAGFGIAKREHFSEFMILRQMAMQNLQDPNGFEGISFFIEQCSMKQE